MNPKALEEELDVEEAAGRIGLAHSVRSYIELRSNTTCLAHSVRSWGASAYRSDLKYIKET